MLLTKEVEIIPSGKSIQYYRDKGYDAKWRESLIVKVEDLPKGSSVNVNVLCDYCKEEIITVPYNNYLKRIETVPKAACKKCKSIKTRECNLINYGVKNVSQLDFVKEKTKQSNRLKYGTDTYLKTEEFKEKSRKSCEEKFGKDYKQVFMRKAHESFYKNSGYQYPSQSPEVREK